MLIFHAASGWLQDQLTILNAVIPYLQEHKRLDLTTITGLVGRVAVAAADPDDVGAALFG